MLIAIDIHTTLAETAMAASGALRWQFVPSDEGRPNYDRALAGRCVR